MTETTDRLLLVHGDMARWTMVSPILATLNENPSAEQLLQTIAILSGVSGPDELPTLQSWLKNNPAQAQQLLRHIPSLISCCRSITSYFPQASLPRLPVIETSKDEAAILSVSLPRRHVHCLLAHMFFCTAKYPTGAVKWWGDFSPWYTTDMGPSEAYISALVTYFEAYFSGKLDDKQPVSFFRRRIPSISQTDMNQNGNVALLPRECILLQESGFIGQDPYQTHVDFANSDVTFGRGGTQEEILLGFSPESCLVSLIADPLTDNECVVIQGAATVANYSGYGLDVKFTAPLSGIETINWSERFIVAMDALCFTTEDTTEDLDMSDFSSWKKKMLQVEESGEVKSIRNQLKEQHLYRELTKAMCAFSPLPAHPHYGQVISTGNWGGGAFGGNQDLKFLIQWAALSIAASQRSLSGDSCYPDLPKMVYYTFGDADFKSRAMAVLGRHQWSSVAALFERIQALENPKQELTSSKILNLIL